VPLSPYACANCGFWQRWFATPPTCPVCTDVRNALPEDGWDFVSAAAMPDRLTSSWIDHGDGLVEFRCSPHFGLGGVGWLLERSDGNVGFEAAPWYDDDAFAEIDRRGGIATLSSSHPHAYGALWQLQERFDAPIVLPRADHGWTKAFGVDLLYDDDHLLADELVLHRTGGHFDGHAVLHDVAHERLFAGDAFKVDVDSAGRAVAVSTHRAWHQRTPLSPGELRRYRDVLAPLPFRTVCSPFGLARGATTADVLAVVDHQLADRPTVIPMEVTT
jgi:hypothetical protein